MLRPQPLPPVPVATARVARSVFPLGRPYLRVADELGDLFTDETFAALFPRRGQPALAPWRLALATILQFAEGLSDRQAADAVRARIDWKYVLRLELYVTWNLVRYPGEANIWTGGGRRWPRYVGTASRWWPRRRTRAPG
jgi:hypothetical protein